MSRPLQFAQSTTDTSASKHPIPHSIYRRASSRRLLDYTGAFFVRVETAQSKFRMLDLGSVRDFGSGFSMRDLGVQAQTTVVYGLTLGSLDVECRIGI